MSIFYKIYLFEAHGLREEKVLRLSLSQKKSLATPEKKSGIKNFSKNNFFCFSANQDWNQF